jgi:hypothetical protein
MKSSKKSIDSLKSQEVSGKKVKGGRSAKIVPADSKDVNNLLDASTLTQGKLNGRPGVKGSSISTAKRNIGSSL